MTAKTKIITLIDNVTYKQGLKAEHGLSFLIKTPHGHILFDTGQSNQLLDNALALGEDLLLVDHVVVSHGHYDHSGGLEAFLRFNGHAVVWMHPTASESKFSTATGQMRTIGMPFSLLPYARRIRYVSEPVQILPGAWLLCDILRSTSYETISPKLFKSVGADTCPDPFDDELVLYLSCPQGLTLVSGCAHRGIVNTLKAVAAHSGIAKFQLVIGGTHLNGAPSHRLEATAKALSEMQIETFMPNHCTGIAAYSFLAANLECQVTYAQVGTVVSVG